jgi:hypothetical protein
MPTRPAANCKTGIICDRPTKSAGDEETPDLPVINTDPASRGEKHDDRNRHSDPPPLVGREQTEKKRNNQVEDKNPEPGNEDILRPAIEGITGVGRTGLRRSQWSIRIVFGQGFTSV